MNKLKILLFLVFFFSFISLSVFAIDVDTCRDIDSSGTYVLINDVSTTGDCFRILGNDIILDCNGYEITGDGGANDNGIELASGINNITIINCNITNFDSGIYASNITNLLIENNELGINEGGILFINGNGTNISIKNNNFTEPKPNGSSNGIEFLTFISDNVVIDGNNWTNYFATYYPILILETNGNINITNNEIKVKDYIGIRVHGNNVAYIANNKIYGESISSGTGISLSSNSIVDNNIITNVQNGLFLNFISGTTIKNNNISSTSVGIYLFQISNNNIIRNNTISNSISYGIQITSDSNNNEISGNSINLASHGIAIGANSMYNNVTNNSITNVTENGIIVENGNYTIMQSNNVTNSTKYGIAVYTSKNVSIFDNNIYKFGTGEGGDGIITKASQNVTVKGNYIKDGRYNLLAIENMNNLVAENNQFKWSNNTNVWIDENSTNVIIRNNIFDQENYVCDGGSRCGASSGQGMSCIGNSVEINFPKNITISNNTFINIWRAMTLKGMIDGIGNYIIENNTINGSMNYQSQISIEDVSNVYIIKNKGSRGSIALSTKNIKNLYIDDFVFNHTSIGLVLDNASNSVIDGVIIDANTSDQFPYYGGIHAGIILMNSKHDILNNSKLYNFNKGSSISSGITMNFGTVNDNLTFENIEVHNSTYGINSYLAENLTIKNSRFYGNQSGQYGIMITQNSNCTIDNNYAYDFLETGIHMQCSDGKIINNHAINNSVGITADEASIVMNNELFSNSLGINIITSNGIFSNNSIHDNNNGIFIDSVNDNIITNNDIYNNYYGILTNLDVNNTISYNKIYNNYDGIFLAYTSEEKIINNSVFNNNNNGIYLYNSVNNTFTDNHLLNNSEDFYSEVSENNTIVNMTINTTSLSFVYSGDISIKSANNPGNIPENYRYTKKFVEIKNESSDAIVNLTFIYDPMDYLNESAIELWKWNEIDGWMKIDDFILDTEKNNVLTQLTGTFSIFTLLERYTEEPVPPEPEISYGNGGYYLNETETKKPPILGVFQPEPINLNNFIPRLFEFMSKNINNVSPVMITKDMFTILLVIGISSYLLISHNKHKQRRTPYGV